ncbi:MAG: Putative polyhydroxyalkanoic acid system protein (PHA_gran_rgn) [uncultured Thermomicrobiales bacterium]|uniref:Polyhydroxyalkanoic acid system protein (PHA_gran_rgn) n=1 Tax=uncultured Thermomicrobiales bacterium TaxID=1645740 RepID=A0A6J4VG60_9BACT|nr:MAG: Putative polyhydroxyalkanoic acid system protein (PHA_gran_rgn) [uncultured Thermomicrobiales bacterium]
MANLEVTVAHRLGEAEAASRVRRLLGEMKTRHADRFTDLREEWDGNTGRFSARAMNFNLAGTLAVGPDRVDVRGDLPFAARPFKGRIETMIREELGRLLA